VAEDETRVDEVVTDGRTAEDELGLATDEEERGEDAGSGAPTTPVGAWTEALLARGGVAAADGEAGARGVVDEDGAGAGAGLVVWAAGVVGAAAGAFDDSAAADVGLGWGQCAFGRCGR
jgi:hypothetical protein